MTTIAKLVAELGLDTGDFDKGVSKVEKSAGGIGGILQTALGTAAGFGIAQKGLDLLGGAFDTVKGAVFGMNSSLQTSELQFGTLMGDAELAKTHVAGLFEFAKKTPFETGPIIEASRMLQTFGGSALNTQEQLTKIGDASAAVNAPINELGFWVGRLYSNLKAGQPFGEASARLQELAVMSPEARSQMEQLQKAGGSAEDVFAIFNKSLGKFTGSMEKQAGTWSGLTSTFSDTLSIVGAQAMKPFFDLASTGLNQLNTLLGEEGVGNAITQFATSFSVGIQQAIVAGTSLFNLFKMLATGDFTGGIFGWDEDHPVILFLFDLRDAVSSAFNSVQTAFTALAPTTERLTTAFVTIKDALGALIPDPLEAMVTGFFEGASNSNMLDSALQGVVTVVNATSEGLANLTKFIQDNKAAQSILIGVIGGVAAAWTAMKVVQIATTIATTGMTAATTAMTVAQAALNFVLTANPIGIIIVAIAALAAGLIYAYNTSEEFRNVVDTAFAVVKGVVLSAIQIITTTITGFKATWDTLTVKIGDATSAISGILQSAFSAYVAIVTLPMNIIIGLVKGFWDALPLDIQTDLTLIATTLLTRFQEFLVSTQTWITNTATTISTGFTQMVSDVTKFMGDMAIAIAAALTGIENGVRTSLTNLKDQVMAPIWGAVTGAVNDVWNGPTGSVVSLIATSISTVLSSMSTFGNELVTALGSIATQVLAAAAAVGQAIIDGMTNAVTAGAQKLANAAADAARAALDAAKAALGISSPSSEGFDIGSQLMAGIGGGMEVGARRFLSGNNLTLPQFGGVLASMGLSADVIAAACGPIAVQGIAAGFGQALDIKTIIASARAQGLWSTSSGMFGPGATQQLLKTFGFGSSMVSAGQAAAAAASGIPVAISTPLHYFLAQDYDPASGKWNVGNTGLALRGGSSWMTLGQIQALAGGVQGFIKPTPMFGGGLLNEPVLGVGASGRWYTLAERGPEWIVPANRMAELGGGGSSGGLSVTVYSQKAILDEQELADVLRRQSYLYDYHA